MLRTRVPISSLRLLTHGPPRSWRANSTLGTLQEPLSNTRSSPSKQSLSTEPSQSGTTIRNPPTEFELEQERETLSRGRHSALIRTWDFIQSPAEAFAIIRAVERKYGRISEYRFHRDYEIPAGYQAIIYVVFHSQESVNLIPEGAEVLSIPAPPTIRDRPGGIGMDELEGLLDAKGKDEVVDVPDFGSVMSGVIESEEEAKKGLRKMISCRIQRSATEFYSPSGIPNFGPKRRIRESIARNFINWGGFYEFQPIEQTIPLREMFLSVKSNIDHIHMRHCLRSSSQLIGVPNPYETRTGSDIPTQLSPGSQSNPSEAITATQPLAESEEVKVAQQVKQSVPTEWEPLPGFESVPEDDLAPTLSGIATALEQSADLSRQTQLTEPVVPSTSVLSQPSPGQPTLDPIVTLDEMSNTVQRLKLTTRNQDHGEETAVQLRAAKNLLHQEKQHLQSRQQQKGMTVGSGKGGKGRKEQESPNERTASKKRTLQPTKRQEQRERMTERLKSLIGSWF